jgi:hypothetical protein
MVSYAIPEYSHPTAVGVFGWYYRVQMKSFEVDTVAPASSAAPVDPVPRDANLTVSDLPPSGFYSPYLHHWYTAKEVARENLTSAKQFNLDPALLDAPGRQISYGVDFYVSSRAMDDLFSNIISFDTAANAQANVASRLSVAHLEAAALPGASNIHEFAVIGVGETGWGLQVDYSLAGASGRITFMEFVRGRYVVYLRLDSDPDPDWAPDPAATAAIAIGLAKTIDGRLPHS